MVNAATSAVATLTVNEGVAITLNPQSRTNNPGTVASFTVAASGTAPLFYQWQKDSVDMALATNATYAIAAVEAGHAGNYRCIVSNMVNAATSAVAALTVNKAEQTITFPNPGPQIVTNTLHLRATASSGLAVTDFALVSGPGVLNGTILTFTHPGTVSIMASQAGDTNWNAAPNVTNTFAVGRADQTIIFPAIPDQITTGIVQLSATASSGLPVTFTVDSGPAIIAGGTQLSFTGPGMVGIVASQAGNANWNAAAPVITTCNVLPAVCPSHGILDADFDGDRKADPSIYDETTGTWTAKISGGGYMTITLPALLGGPGYAVAVGDYDDDRISDPAVYQESTGNWKVMQSGSGYAMLERVAFLGASGWSAAVADYDGDHKADYGVYEEATGNWKIKLSSAGYHEIDLNGFLGSPENSAISADYDGDGLADPAVYNRTDGTWKVLLSSAGYAPVTLPQFLGGAGWNAVPGDYDGDGKIDPAIRKTDGGVWRIMLSGSGYVPIDLLLGL